MKRPTSAIERELTAQGHKVIGVDEVGCGSLAGPVIAAAVHLPLSIRIPHIADSKLLTAKKREAIFWAMLKQNVTISFGIATVQEVDEKNVRQASLLAMHRAVVAQKDATYALVDAWKIPDISIPQRAIIRGDRTVRSIAAASIAAKVVRDWMMLEYDREFPGYEFALHKGYGTARHHARLKERGPISLHRKTFLKKFFQGELF